MAMSVVPYRMGLSARIPARLMVRVELARRSITLRPHFMVMSHSVVMVRALQTARLAAAKSITLIRTKSPATRTAWEKLWTCRTSGMEMIGREPVHLGRIWEIFARHSDSQFANVLRGLPYRYSSDPPARVPKGNSISNFRT